MKIYFLIGLFFLCTPLSISAQDVTLYLIPESVEKVITNTEHNVSDPQITDNSSSNPGVHETDEYLGGKEDDSPDDETDADEADEEEKTIAPARTLGMSVETVLTPTSKFVRIPVSFRTGRVALTVSVPYYYQRTMKYSHGLQSTTGLGDVQVRASYDLQGNRLYTRIQGHVKLPTGDANKLVNGYLVPLGTGTIDYMFGNIFLAAVGPFHFFNNVNYRISGSHSRVVEIHYTGQNVTERIEYDVSNGNTFILNTVLSYPVWYGLSIQGGVSVIANEQGSMDRKHSYDSDRADVAYTGISANQDFLFVDAQAGLALNVLGTDITANVMQPVVTQRCASNSEDVRSLMFYLRLSRKLF